MGVRHPREVRASAENEGSNGAGSGGEEPESQEAQVKIKTVATRLCAALASQN